MKGGVPWCFSFASVLMSLPTRVSQPYYTMALGQAWSVTWPTPVGPGWLDSAGEVKEVRVLGLVESQRAPTSSTTARLDVEESAIGIGGNL
jgi:hypothetical protein